jgi:hypothetical protein
MPVTNDQIYAYLVDLSANIAVQFAEVLTQGDYIQTQNTTISNQVSNVQGYLESEINTGLLEITNQVSNVQGYLESEINTGIILNTEQLNAVIIQGDVIQNQITQQTNDINTNTNTALSQYTNTINTNTNTALSQYTNTINTNTNESVSTAVHDINSKIEKTC